MSRVVTLGESYKSSLKNPAVRGVGRWCLTEHIMGHLDLMIVRDRALAHLGIQGSGSTNPRPWWR
ncbi:hypothetical protein N7488_006535 [Penicillium malachiteum]|nr:hypothetical protein N7488_006535 [Penicillium malachiteum]